jgi:hypothetical protein
MEKNFTVVLNCYKRPHTLKEQYEALLNQTIKPKEILIWQNKGDLEDFKPLDEFVFREAKSSISNANFGVWSRFAYALNAQNENIAVFDDDTIPGCRWLENCIETWEEGNEGLLGTIGVISNDLSYNNYSRFGWANPNEKTEKVDFVGHSWVFKKEWLGAFWREAVSPDSIFCGEDVHFSYAIQKYLGLNTYVPKHPFFEKDFWGSIPEKAMEYGTESHCVSINMHQSHFGKTLQNYYNKGFKFINFK